jgi:hypothetical protein
MRTKVNLITTLSICIAFYFQCSSAFIDGYDELNETIPVVSTIAGGDGGITFPTASFNITYYDSALYLCAPDITVIKRIDCTSLTVTDYFDYSTVRGFPMFSSFADKGSLYIGDIYSIYKLDLGTKTCSFYCGITGSGIYTNGTYSETTLGMIGGITGINDELYIVDSIDTIRKLSNNTVTILAGTTSSAGGFADGTADSALFGNLKGAVYDGTNLYTCDLSNNAIRCLDTKTQIVKTIAGSPPSSGAESGYIDGPGLTARFNQPAGIVKLGNALYITEEKGHALRKIDLSDYTVSTIAGNGTNGYIDGVASDARFGNLRGIATDGRSLYVCDVDNRAIRKIEFIAKGKIK